MYVASDAIDPWIDDAESNALRSKVDFLVVQDTTVTPLAHLADVVLAGATFAEKAGCYVNAGGRLQYSEAALPPRDGSLPDLDLLAILSNRPGGPVKSSEVLAEMAETIPAFAVAKGGVLPRYGVVLGDADAAGRAAGAAEFHGYLVSRPWGRPGTLSRMYSVGLALSGAWRERPAARALGDGKDRVYVGADRCAS